MQDTGIYKIILWGAGNTAKEALQYISNTVVIIGVLDNNPAIKEFEGIPVLEKKHISTYDYDYIVICSIYYEEIYRQLLHMGISAYKILEYSFFKSERYRIYRADFFAGKWRILEKREKPEIFISGISYHNDGIDEDIFHEEVGKSSFNFALRGQDIFYDYQIVKLLDRESFLQNTTHYIIGLCYYSFEYDMSKSTNAWEIIRYYPYIQEQHNLATACSFEKFVRDMESKIIEEEIYYKIFRKRKAYELNSEAGREQAKADFNKNYPITVWENKNIFKEFLIFLKERNIKPIVVIMPAMQEYVLACPQRFKKNFYETLRECVTDQDIQILDYFGDYYGEVSDYYHVTHFNKLGAKKFTKKLARDIVW
ncbi:MAG: hypothetical protein J6C19_03660 [Lachnospiraceae bacterium]|nr:hypothetical protein [Lachnospiraceae bacterium]